MILSMQIMLNGFINGLLQVSLKPGIGFLPAVSVAMILGAIFSLVLLLPSWRLKRGIFAVIFFARFMNDKSFQRVVTGWLVGIIRGLWRKEGLSALGAKA